jgi:hypothetical protein
MLNRIKHMRDTIQFRAPLAPLTLSADAGPGRSLASPGLAPIASTLAPTAGERVRRDLPHGAALAGGPFRVHPPFSLARQ